MGVGVVVVKTSSEICQSIKDHTGCEVAPVGASRYVLVFPSASSYDGAVDEIKGALSHIGEGDIQLADLEPCPPN